MTRSLLLPTLLLTLVAGCDDTSTVTTSGQGQTEPAASSDERAATSSVERELVVEGMHCATCPVTVRAAAQGVPGVSKARVDMDKGRAWVTFNRTETSVEQIAAAISEAGYPAKPVEAADKNP